MTAAQYWLVGDADMNIIAQALCGAAPCAADRAEWANATWALPIGPEPVDIDTVAMVDGKLVDRIELLQQQAIDAINAAASARIFAAYPQWRQNNDALDPDAFGRAARIAERDRIITWSNDISERIRGASSRSEIDAVLQEEGVA